MTTLRSSTEAWAIILAAGDGSRLAPLTRQLYGVGLPKQFATLWGDRSLLQGTLERVGRLIPSARTLVVVPAAHRDIAAQQLAPFAGVQVVEQPRNLGTGPGILLPLARLLRLAPEAPVAIFPSDHHVEAPAPLLQAVDAALDATREARFPLALVGIAPTGPEVEYGWIVPGAGVMTESRRLCFRPVRRFVEKPGRALAARLVVEGGLWNAFILCGRVRDIWELARLHLPQHALLFERHYLPAVEVMAEEPVLQALYGRMPSANFSHQVLQHASGLAVVRVDGSGWTDLGSPERVLGCLDGNPEHRPVLARLRGIAGPAPAPSPPVTTLPTRTAASA